MHLTPARHQPDATFQNIVSDARQTPARHNISKSGVRRKMSKSRVRRYFLWPCVRRAVWVCYVRYWCRLIYCYQCYLKYVLSDCKQLQCTWTVWALQNIGICDVIAHCWDGGWSSWLLMAWRTARIEQTSHSTTCTPVLCVHRSNKKDRHSVFLSKILPSLHPTSVCRSGGGISRSRYLLSPNIPWPSALHFVCYRYWVSVLFYLTNTIIRSVSATLDGL